MALIGNFENLRIRQCPKAIGKRISLSELKFAADLVKPFVEKELEADLGACIGPEVSGQLALKYGQLKLIYLVRQNLCPLTVPSNQDLKDFGFDLDDQELELFDESLSALPTDFFSFFVAGLDAITIDGQCYAHLLLQSQDRSNQGVYKVSDACITNWTGLWNGKYLMM